MIANKLVTAAIAYARCSDAYAESAMYAARDENTSLSDIKNAIAYVNTLKELATNEVREYTDKYIFFDTVPFSGNHLYVVRGIYCDFAEYTDTVSVFLKPNLNAKNNPGT